MSELHLPNGGIHEVKTGAPLPDPTTRIQPPEKGFHTEGFMAPTDNEPIIPGDDRTIDVYDVLNTHGVIMGNPDDEGALTPEQALTQGMKPLPEGTDVKVIAAVVDVLSRASCSDFEIAFDDEKEPEHAWAAHCELRGGEDATVRHWSSPEEAAVRLARKVLNGSRCASCARIMTVIATDTAPRSSLEHRYCFWTREGTQFVRGCRDTHTEMQATKEAFAEVTDG